MVLISLADLKLVADDLQRQMLTEEGIKGKKMVELEITFPKQVVQIGDQVSYTIEFKNTHELLPLTFWWYDHDFHDFVTVRKTCPDGKVYVIDSRVYATVRSTGPECYTLKPGEKKIR